jgi:hypothetical protein
VTRILTVLLLCLSPVFLYAQPSTPPAPAREQSDLDALMATVLQRRDENWRRLHDYVLREKEVFALNGPGRVRLFGSEREFMWYQREGYLVRSPTRYDKVTLDDTERRKYEEQWLRKEKERETEHAKKAAETAARHRSAEEPPVYDVESFMREGGEPRFISEAYFLEFKFEPGNYYFAGRETLDGREVLKIEYYPTDLYNDGEDDDERAARQKRREAREREREARNKERKKKGEREIRIGDNGEEEIERKMNKVSVVTLWVDPAVRQIVKFTFENVDFGFLPGRWLVRVGDVKASMVMSQPFPDVWLPRELTFEGEVKLAVGTVAARYTREYFEYKQGEVRSKIRHYGDIKE